MAKSEFVFLDFGMVTWQNFKFYLIFGKFVSKTSVKPPKFPTKLEGMARKNLASGASENFSDYFENLVFFLHDLVSK